MAATDTANPPQAARDGLDPTDDLLAHALAYAARGWRVFPLADRGKLPRKGSHGFKDASTDLEQIRSWWAKWPRANIGIATGGGLLVLDVDGDQGRTALLEHAWGIPPTSYVRTGRADGGAHYYLQGDGRSCVPHPGVEVKGTGAYVVAPPSIHPSGTVYSWAPGASPDDRPLALAPAWLTKAATPATPTPARRTDLRLPDPVPGAAAACKASSAYGLAALAAEVRALAAAPLGTRNDTLAKAAFCCGRLMAGGELLHDDAWPALVEACKANGLLDTEQGKTYVTISRGFIDSGQHPRRAPCLRLDRRLVNASLKPTGLFYGALVSLTHGRASQKALAATAGVSDRALRNWRAELSDDLLTAAADVPTGCYVGVPVSLLLADRESLSPGAKATYIHLKALADGGRAKVGQAALAKRACMSVSALKRHLRTLKREGWIASSMAKFCWDAKVRLGVNVYHLRDTAKPAPAGLPATNRKQVTHREAQDPPKAANRKQVTHNPILAVQGGWGSEEGEPLAAVCRTRSSQKKTTDCRNLPARETLGPERNPRCEETQKARPARPGPSTLPEVPADILQALAERSGVPPDELSPDLIRSIRVSVSHDGGADELRKLLRSAPYSEET